MPYVHICLALSAYSFIGGILKCFWESWWNRVFFKLPTGYNQNCFREVHIYKTLLKTGLKSKPVAEKRSKRKKQGIIHALLTSRHRYDLALRAVRGMWAIPSDVMVCPGPFASKFISVNTAARRQLWSKQKHANHVNTKIHDLQLLKPVRTKYAICDIHLTP